MSVSRAPSLFTSKNLQYYLITLCILGLALCASLWKIESLPSGIHSDEAWEGIDAARILYQGVRPIFLVDNNGRQPLFAYLVAFMFWIFGPTTPEVSAPYSQRTTVLQKDGLECLGCHRFDCPVEGHPCMNAIEADRIFSALKANL